MEKLPVGGFGFEIEKSPPAFTPPLFDVSVGSTDEEVMLFLRGRKAGDPIPANVITEVNPFSLEPWDSPEGMWYLYNSSNYQTCTEGRNIEVTGIGYWKPVDDIKMFRDDDARGVKTTLEFYIGPKSFGNRTGWVMHEYHRDQKDCKSMCTMFWQNDRVPTFCDFKLLDEEKHSSFCSYDNNDDDVDHLEGTLMKFLEDEENGSSTNTPNKSQPFTGSEQVVQAVAGSERLAPPLDERRPTLTNTSFYNSNGSSPSDSHSYLELNDLHDPDSASSCSDNSSVMSGDSDDYFDSEELVSFLGGTSSQNIQEQQNNHKFCVSTSVINPAQPADNIHPKRTHSRSSDSSSSSYGSGSKSLGRIVKFGKKYCCLRTL